MTLADSTIDIRSQLTGTELETLGNEAKFNLPNFVGLGIRVLLVGIAISSFISLLYGSFQWITSGGEKEGIEKARKKITNAIVGLLIAMSLFAFVRLINVMFGVDLAGNLDIPTL